jgi:glycosyltransferase involved in cell wall biosynthesis
MKISVAICTWNRAAQLDQTLEAMHQLHTPPRVEWELVVINNQCTDDTAAVVERHSRKLPIKTVDEPTLGQSNARNKALEVASGELILWTDDDVLVDRMWLSEYCAAASRWPRATYFGGLILPWYECVPPRWVERNLRFLKGVLLVRDLGPGERPFEGREEPSGASMMFRREVFDNWRFEPRLGLVGNSPVRGEDTQLIETLRKRGEQGIWVPGAVVRHFVPASRMTQEYLWQWAYGWGRGIVRRQRLANGSSLPPALPWRARFSYAQNAMKYYAARMCRLPSWPIYYHHLGVASGMLAEHRETSDECGSNGKSQASVPSLP